MNRILPVFLLAVVSIAACNRSTGGAAAGPSAAEASALAVQFTQSLAARNYDAAHAMTSREYQQRSDAKALAADFERIVPPDWGAIGAIEVVGDVRSVAGNAQWVYVSIAGDAYGEGLSVVVAREGERNVVREIEFGRP